MAGPHSGTSYLTKRAVYTRLRPTRRSRIYKRNKQAKVNLTSAQRAQWSESSKLYESARTEEKRLKRNGVPMKEIKLSREQRKERRKVARNRAGWLQKLNKGGLSNKERATLEKDLAKANEILGIEDEEAQDWDEDVGGEDDDVDGEEAW